MIPAPAVASLRMGQGRLAALTIEKPRKNVRVSGTDKSDYQHRTIADR
jgi:hypothetical protein